MTLQSAIERGLKEEASSITAELAEQKDALDIINEELIPALNNVGEGFEKKNCIPSTASDECRVCKECICSTQRKKWIRAGKYRRKKERSSLRR